MANVKAYQELERRTKFLKTQMEELEKIGEENSDMYKKLEDAAYSNVVKMAGLVDGSKQATDEFNKQKKAVDPLTSSLFNLAKAYISIQGARKLISMSDTYTQTHARLGMITEDVDGLEAKIYQSAQRSRVSTQSLSDTVSKLGMQASEAFGGSTDQILAFTETLNKVFTISGMDASSIGSVMYNMTQSLSTGRLLGQDYRILKQNSPLIIKYLRQYYGDITQAQLDEMVSKGKVSAQDLKNAMFKASDEIEEKFNKMPVTFEQAWTKFKNTLQRMLIPVFKWLTKVAEALDKLFTFLSKHKYILYAFAGVIALVTANLIRLKIASAVSSLIDILGNAAALATLKFSLWAIAIAIVASVLLYLWNTNDKAAYKMLETWDKFIIGIRLMGVGLVSFFTGILNILETIINAFFGAWINAINDIIEAMNRVDGGDRKTINIHYASENLGKWVDNQMADIERQANEMNSNRYTRTRERQKIGYEEDLAASVGSIASLIDTSASGGAALKTTSSDNLLKDEDIQLLLDVATRDFKLNYQHITPEIAVNFTGDINRTVDIEETLDVLAERMEEIQAGDLEAVSYGY